MNNWDLWLFSLRGRSSQCVIYYVNENENCNLGKNHVCNWEYCINQSRKRTILRYYKIHLDYIILTVEIDYRTKRKESVERKQDLLWIRKMKWQYMLHNKVVQTSRRSPLLRGGVCSARLAWTTYKLWGHPWSVTRDIKLWIMWSKSW